MKKEVKYFPKTNILERGLTTNGITLTGSGVEPSSELGRGFDWVRFS